MDKEKVIKHYSELLPQRICASTGGTPEEGYWAKITAEGTNLQNCYTQAASIPELILMINDAVKTHYEIPEDLREKVGFYTPITENHLQWEEMFNRLVSMGSKEGEVDTALQLAPAVAA